MKPLIVANWKMNPQTYKEAEDLIAKILKETNKITGVNIIFCLPFVWLTDFSHKNKSSAFFGAQDVFFQEKGAFTGAISPEMLKSSQVEYVIIGHSERRKYFGETGEIVNKKIRAALKAGLKVILCVGETEEEKDRKGEILEKQITQALQGVTHDEMKNVVIAYEPVWAIGTGNNCSVDEAQKSLLFIRKIITNVYKREVADGMKLLYGGSVKAENSGAYIKEGNANGLLVGGASLIAEEFIEIVKSAE
ncbi:MAG: triose-phosphate isomerase [bacterium]|nr:triose-phosphate isomerase [bacterium]